MLTKYNMFEVANEDINLKWYRADEVDKELSALSGTELAKENTRLRLLLAEKDDLIRIRTEQWNTATEFGRKCYEQLQEKREDTKAGEDMIVELRAKIKQFALCYEVQPEECYKHCDILKEKDAQIWNYQEVIKANEKQQLALMKQINDTDKQFELLIKCFEDDAYGYKYMIKWIKEAQRGELR